MLPDYLRFETPHAAAKKDAVVTVGDVRFTVITPSLIRIEQGRFCDDATIAVINRSFAASHFRTSKENGILRITTDELELTYHIGTQLSANTLSIRRLHKPLIAWCFGDKPLNNLGGTISTLDHVDGVCELEDGVCSLDGYALLDDSETPIMLKDGWFDKRPEGVTDLYFFGYGHDYTVAVQDYYRLTGIPKLVPAFALGNWWSRFYKYTDTEYLALMDKFKSANLPFSVGIVDMDWHITDGDGVRPYSTEGWTGYTWNKKFFPDYKKFLKGLKDRNLKTALNLHPASGVRNWEEQYEAMAEVLGCDTSEGKPISFDCLDQDFLRAYFEILHFPYEEDGVNFWWMDWQQGYDYSWIHNNGGEVKELECMSPLWILNHMHYLASERNGNRGLIFSRFAGTGSQRYPIGFSGDAVTSWDSLNFQPYFTATASNIGYTFWSHDIGGHCSGMKDDELNTRWVQFGVFSPIFRLHSSNNLFSGREPWKYNKRAELVISDFMRLRHQLFPYIYTMSYRNCTELIPIMRPLYHTNPEDKAAYEVKNEYWFGSEMIVAPITAPADSTSGLAATDAWLPEGKWVDMFTGYVYRGGTKFKACRPLEQMPIFLKAGAIVPMQANILGDNTLGRAENMEITIAAGANGNFVLYEDDGETLCYADGEYCTTELNLDWTENNLIFTIKAAQGSTELIPNIRNYKLRFVGFAAGADFGADAVYNPRDNSYTVNVNDVDTDKGFEFIAENANGLMADNSDVRDRVIEILELAQCRVKDKNRMLTQYDNTIGRGCRDLLFTICPEKNNINNAIAELVDQIEI